MSLSFLRPVLVGLLLTAAICTGVAAPVSARAEEGKGIDWNNLFDGTPAKQPKPTNGPAEKPENQWGGQKEGTVLDPDIDTKAQGYAACPSLPPTAARYIPDPLNSWMQIVCPEDGGVYIAPVTGYQWKLGNRDDFVIAAEQSGGFLNRGKMPESGYFTQIGFEHLVERKRESASKLFSSVVTHAGNGPEARKEENAFSSFWRMYLVNDSEQEMNLYVYMIDEEPRWLITCSKDCKDYELVKIVSPKKTTDPAGLPSIIRR